MPSIHNSLSFVHSFGHSVIDAKCVVAPGEGLDYKAMGSIFSGLVQCGAWGCFDEFNRIEAEVLSVVSSQIRQIQEALKNGLTRFPFEGILHVLVEAELKALQMLSCGELA